MVHHGYLPLSSMFDEEAAPLYFSVSDMLRVKVGTYNLTQSTSFVMHNAIVNHDVIQRMGETIS